VVSGARAAAPLEGPCLARVQPRVGRGGLLVVGDWPRAAQATRACIALAGEDAWCPLPQGHRGEGAREAALERVWRGEPPRTSVLREQARGEPPRLAPGEAPAVPRRVDVEGKRQAWTERRLVVRALRQAEAAEAARRARGAQATAHVEALPRRGRGGQRLAELTTVRQAVTAMVPPHRVADCVWRRDDPHTTAPQVRAEQERPADVQQARHAPVAGRGDEEALASAVRRVGWRMPHTPPHCSRWRTRGWASRRASLGEHRGSTQGRPRSDLLAVPRDDQATGLRRGGAMARRVVTRVACVVRRPWAAADATGAGLSAGQATRATARPTAARFREALHAGTLTVVAGVHRVSRHWTARRP
jgi:hypothetical protein